MQLLPCERTESIYHEEQVSVYTALYCIGKLAWKWIFFIYKTLYWDHILGDDNIDNIKYSSRTLFYVSAVFTPRQAPSYWDSFLEVPKFETHPSSPALYSLGLLLIVYLTTFFQLRLMW
jgi:hypothetical protein